MSGMHLVVSLVSQPGFGGGGRTQLLSRRPFQFIRLPWKAQSIEGWGYRGQSNKTPPRSAQLLSPFYGLPLHSCLNLSAPPAWRRDSELFIRSQSLPSSPPFFFSFV